MAFSILATIIRLHIINHVDLSAIIDTYKLKENALKKITNLSPQLKKQHPLLCKAI